MGGVTDGKVLAFGGIEVQLPIFGPDSAAIRVSFENMSMKEYLDLQDSSLLTLWSEKRINFRKM